MMHPEYSAEDQQEILKFLEAYTQENVGLKEGELSWAAAGEEVVEEQQEEEEEEEQEEEPAPKEKKEEPEAED
jgi:hypothetical protein